MQLIKTLSVLIKILSYIQALVECDGDSIDLGGDVGAVGRIVISNGSKGNHEMLLDLKGSVYKASFWSFSFLLFYRWSYWFYHFGLYLMMELVFVWCLDKNSQLKVLSNNYIIWWMTPFTRSDPFEGSSNYSGKTVVLFASVH